ncbi:MAG: sigma-E processing peptidase SpoIIGA [Thermoflexaceae bacterium]|nr:sigma-E processing peptidase SpoIIGA [Thermoflexaceae bacterium]
MQYKIYLDVFFVVNFIMDYIVLRITCFILDIYAGIWRRIGASFLGGMWAALEMILMTYHEHLKIFLTIITYTAVPFLMLLIIMGWSNRKIIKKSLLVLYVVTFCLSGICYAGWNYLEYGYAIVSGIIRKEQIISGTVILGIVMFLMKIMVKVRKKYGNDICKVIVTIHNHRIQFSGLMDTGNVLTDPYTGKSVHIVRAAVMNRVLLRVKDYATLHYRLIPYNSVGNESGLLPVIDVECMEIYECNRMIFKDSAAIGIYDGALCKTCSYDALINAAVFRN